MLPVINHPWNVKTSDARDIQSQLRRQVILTPLSDPICTIAAVDVSYTRWDKIGYAVLGIFSIIYDNNSTDLSIKEESIKTRIDSVNFPYVPGYLSFREIPMLLPLFEKISTKIDLIIVDGQGIAHPRGMGLASHLGLIFDIPGIGCAKSKLIGEYSEPGMHKGDYSDLHIKNRIVGAVLRSKEKCRPLFVSPGYKCTIEDAREMILKLCTKYRLCEPIRRVDGISKALRKSHQNNNHVLLNTTNDESQPCKDFLTS